MGEWGARTVTLGDLAKDGLLDLGDGYRTKRAEHGKPGLPILRVAEVLDGKIVPKFEDYVSDTFRAAMGAKISQPGDIVLTTKGTVGRVAIMPSDGVDFVYSPQLCYFRVRAQCPLHPRYLYYWFKGGSFWRQALYRKSQTDMADYINLADIRSLEVEIPPMTVQQAITAVLGALDDKIAVNERIAATCESLSVALASEEKWLARTELNELVQQQRSQVSPSELADDSVAHYSLPAFDASRAPEIVQPGTIKSAKFLIDRHSVLVSKLNPATPRIWDVNPDPELPALASTEFMVLRPVDGLNPAEVWSVCCQPGFTEQLSSRATGTSNSHQRVRPAELLKSMVVDVRTIPEEIRMQISDLAKRARAARYESIALAQLRDTLLPKLMSGELRVRDAEKMVEDAT